MWQIILFALVGSVWVIWGEKYAVLQSKTQIADYLTNPKALQDVAVLITIESFIALAFCFTALQVFLGEKSKRWKKLLIFFPGLLIFPVLFFGLTQSIFSFPGVSFKTVTYGVSAIVFILIAVGSSGFKWLLSEKEFRLEVHFLVSLFVLLTGLLTTVNNHVIYTYNGNSQNRTAAMVALGIFVFIFTAGWGLNKLKWLRSDKKRIENLN